MLHWVPCWFEDTVQDLDGIYNVELEHQNLVLKNLSSLAGGDFEEYCRLRKKADSFKELLQKLRQLKPAAVAREVPADGNCGAWSLLCMASQSAKRALSVDAMGKQEMAHLRKQIQALWESYAEQDICQTFLELAVPGNAADTDGSAQKKFKPQVRDDQDGAQEAAPATPPTKSGARCAR